MAVRTMIAGAIAATVLAAGALPALAWEQLDLGTTSSGKPTYAPEGQLKPERGLTFDNLPGVQLNRGQQQVAGDGDCAQSRYDSPGVTGFGSSGTMTECNFGRFSLRTYQPGSGNNGITGYDPFPVPEPLQQDGPPPGSGGAAPQFRW